MHQNNTAEINGNVVIGITYDSKSITAYPMNAITNPVIIIDNPASRKYKPMSGMTNPMSVNVYLGLTNVKVKQTTIVSTRINITEVSVINKFQGRKTTQAIKWSTRVSGGQGAID